MEHYFSDEIFRENILVFETFFLRKILLHSTRVRNFQKTFYWGTFLVTFIKFTFKANFLSKNVAPVLVGDCQKLRITPYFFPKKLDGPFLRATAVVFVYGVNFPWSFLGQLFLMLFSGKNVIYRKLFFVAIFVTFFENIFCSHGIYFVILPHPFFSKTDSTHVLKLLLLV